MRICSGARRTYFSALTCSWAGEASQVIDRLVLGRSTPTLSRELRFQRRPDYMVDVPAGSPSCKAGQFLRIILACGPLVDLVSTGSFTIRQLCDRHIRVTHGHGCPETDHRVSSLGVQHEREATVLRLAHKFHFDFRAIVPPIANR